MLSAIKSLTFQSQNIKLKVSIRAQNIGDISGLLISCDQDFNFNHPVEILNQSAVEETEELQPEAKERTLAISKSTEGLLLNEAGVVVFEDTVIGAGGAQQQLYRDM